MNQGQRKEIIDYLDKGPSFYDFSSDLLLECNKGYNFFEDYVKPQLEKDMKVLDVGCGDGATLSAISDLIDKGCGIEIDENRYKRAVKENEDNGNIEIVNGDVSDVSIDDSFDLIISQRGPTLDVIDKVRAWLREGGIFFVERIGEQHHRVFKEIMGRGQDHGAWDGKSASTREEQVLKKKGFEVVFIQNHFCFSYYKNIVDLAKNIFATPTIDYRGEGDLDKLETVEKRLGTKKGLRTLNHYITYKAKKV